MGREDDTGRDAPSTGAPERLVVDDPPPEPYYPRYRAEPGERLSLSDVNPGESEH